MNVVFNGFSKIYSFLIGFFGISGGVLALLQWNNSIKIKRAEYLSNLYNKLNDNKTIKSILYMFDYDKETW